MSDGLCQCGCGQPAPIATRSSPPRGHVVGEPLRFINGHNQRGRRSTPERRKKQGDAQRASAKLRRGADHPQWKGTPAERFASKVGERDGNGCIPWLGGVFSTGYGQLHLSRSKVISAHRFAYEQARGPIPEGHHLHHVCENPICVNPEHLVPITPSDHVLLHHGRAA